MTLEQKTAVEALAGVTIYYPGKAKRFQTAMKEKLLERPESNLSDRQWQFVRELLHTYRRQVSTHLHKTFCPDPDCQRKMAEQEALERQLCFSF